MRRKRGQKGYRMLMYEVLKKKTYKRKAKQEFTHTIVNGKHKMRYFEKRRIVNYKKTQPFSG